MRKISGIAVLSGLLVFPIAAQAQGVVGGAERGAAEGNRALGPVGGLVGGVVGGVTGGVAGVLGVDQAPRFHEYVVQEHRSSYAYPEDVRVGSVLPQSGVAYYPVPEEYRVGPQYRYTVVNDRTVLVDPQTGRIVQIID